MIFTKSKIFLFCCISFIAGIALASFLPIEWIGHGLGWFIGVVSWVVVLILFWKHKKIRLIAFLGLFFFLGFWRYAVNVPLNTPDKIWHYNGQEIIAQGIVCNEPDVRQKNAKYEICVGKAISVGAIHELPVHELPVRELPVRVYGKVLVTTNLYPSYDYGDELEIACELKAPEEFSGFAYDRYLARYDIYSVCYWPKIKLLDKGQGNRLYSIIYKLKNKLRQRIEFGLSEPAASLANAIVLGYKKNIPENLRENFSQAGISHIVAISGMHISILAALAMSLLLGIGLSRRKAFWLASLFLLLYIILIGLPASAMRAGLMGFLVLWAMNLGRLNKLTNSLVLVAAILLLINPKLLRDDIGFQLSFLAILGIIYVFPILDSWFNRFSNSSKVLKGVFNILNITIAAQILTLPIIAYNFSQISIIAPISNLLILWSLPLLMITVLAGLILSLILPNLSWLFFLPAYFLLKYIILVVDWLVKIPYAYIEIDYLWWGWIAGYYVIVVWAVIKFRVTRNA